MYFSLLLPNPNSPTMERTIIVVGFTNEVICLTTTLQALLSQSEPEFLAHIKTVFFIQRVAVEDRCPRFCLFQNQLFLINFC